MFSKLSGLIWSPRPADEPEIKKTRTTTDGSLSSPLPSLASFTYDCPTHLLVSGINTLSTRLQHNAHAILPSTTSSHSPEVIQSVLQSIVRDLAWTPALINRKLPPELFRHTMGFLCDCDCEGGGQEEMYRHQKCYASWCAASMVCKAWRNEAQRRLHRVVFLESDYQVERFLASDLYGKIETKKLWIRNNLRYQVLLDSMGRRLAEVVRGIVGLESLHLVGFAPPGNAPGYFSSYTPLLDRLVDFGSLSNLTTLVLDGCELDQSEDSEEDPPALPSFNLRSLTLDDHNVYVSNPDTNTPPIFHFFANQPLVDLNISWGHRNLGSGE